MPVMTLELPDGRTHEVEVSPLKGGVFWQQLAPPRFTAAGDILVLVPSPYLRALGAVVTVLGIAWLIAAIVSLKDDWTPLPLIGFGSSAVTIPIGLYFLLGATQVTFDHQRAVVRIATALSTQDFPLTKVIALQAIFGGWHEMEDEKRRVPSYQLNVVFAAPNVSRVALANLGSEPSPSWPHQSAASLEFPLFSTPTRWIASHSSGEVQGMGTVAWASVSLSYARAPPWISSRSRATAGLTVTPLVVRRGSHVRIGLMNLCAVPLRQRQIQLSDWEQRLPG